MGAQRQRLVRVRCERRHQLCPQQPGRPELGDLGVPPGEILGRIVVFWVLQPLGRHQLHGQAAILGRHPSEVVIGEQDDFVACLEQE